MSLLSTPEIEVPDLAVLACASDSDLFDGMRHWAARVRSAQTVVAAISAEIARRSARERGLDGLAQRAGARTPENLVSQLTGTSLREARDLVTAGTLVDATPAWLGDVAGGVRDGSLSVGVAAAISSGLGEPSQSVAADDLLDAARRLVSESPGHSADQVARRAREVRDELDAAGVADRLAALREKRFFRFTRYGDGSSRIFAQLDPEGTALVSDIYDAVTSPRRGGPRFVDAEEHSRQEAIQNDPRTTDQLAHDAFVELLRIGASVDPNRILGIRQPSVRIHVNARDLIAANGVAATRVAAIEGQSARVPATVAERLACADGYIPVVVNVDGSIDVGRAQRLFTARQRVALAAIWGGCAFAGCDRPPSWTEAHHAIPWSHGGRTDTANGVLLCRHHHLLVHDNGWTIRPPGSPTGRWMMHPPPGDPLHRGPVELEKKNPVHRRTVVRT